MEPDDLEDDILHAGSNAGLVKKLHRHEQSIAGIAKNVSLLLESLGMAGDVGNARHTPAPCSFHFGKQ
eukprot:8308770-Prorocentrum_lima.AAC.1